MKRKCTRSLRNYLNEILHIYMYIYSIKYIIIYNNIILRNKYKIKNLIYALLSIIERKIKETRQLVLQLFIIFILFLT